MDLASLAQTFQETVLSGPLLLALPVALIAGFVSFASPCVLPLVPGYLGYLGGMTGADLAETSGRQRGRLLAGVLLFIAGFSVVFVGLGLVFVTVGARLQPHMDVVLRVLGVVVVLMGLSFAGWLPFFQRERRLHLAPRASLAGAGLLGVTFGFGWAPCIGPTLAAILTLSLPTESPARGGLLALVYCLGLGVPFLVIALAFRRSARSVGFLKRHRVAIMRFGGVMLILLGLALVTGVWQHLSQLLQGWVAQYGTIL
ncbi:cytochrome c biogenesis CcdA family protein [Litorihabitans aurantiacus]|uniref:Cytochrome C biogenesis protein CcdA n=1 Tax=Litorihabitans aurantiacus TaxID=1930061 RepID=A0AA37XGM1_9MICO|nr:cytochrome c biogenesis CcdA family protein [Litorihabitans aurantiacus]GMA32407.1 cytochrome C biogenesis protein CcdA [Litorihabitans aurantiacus]